MIGDKYPRTFHLPFSPGATSDDKRMYPGWFEDLYIGNKELVLTEKLDGENIHMNQRGVFARSDGAETRKPWSRNLWENDGLYWKVKQFLSPEETIYGENLFGIHSIIYDELPEYFHLFAAKEGERWFSWEEVEEMAVILGVRTVPVLWKGKFASESLLQQKILELMSKPSTYGKEKEGIVVRTADEFWTTEEGMNSFPFHVWKYVRPNHVQTDQHWTKNWKKAELIN